ncbi:MAG: hypothetical protein ACFB2Z_03325 [Maricaulaceae bacterium]
MDIGLVISEFAPIPVGVVIAATAYFFTKRREREAEWRQVKLKHYEEFIQSLTTIIIDKMNIENKVAFCRATNNLMLFAPQDVLNALHEYQDCSRVCYKGTQQDHDEKLKNLMLLIRKDIGVTPRDKADTFSTRLWAPPP